jgi:hypothetical protein
MSSTAEIYAEYRRRHLPAVLSLREPADFHDPIPVSERLVQVIWAEQLFDSDGLRTRDGRPLRVIHPGRWNEEGGPDFSDARLEIDGRLVPGDIEVHLQTAGWDEHDHASNPRYCQVVLDVCLWDDGEPRPVLNSDGMAVPQLVLSPRLQTSLDELVESLDPDSYPFSPARITGPANPLQGLPKEQLLEQIASAGLYRFQQKSARIADAIREFGADQAAYMFLAEALGYRHNKWVFREVATAVPLPDLLGWPVAEEKINLLLWEAVRRGLRVSQVRPANHPERRLAALALLAHAHPGMAAWFGEIGADASRLRRPPPCTHPFWSRHAHRRSAQFKTEVALVGPTRWLEIVVNVILPFCHARETVRDAGHSSILDLYQQMPAPQSNLFTRRIAYDLHLPEPRKACLQQGLIQIYHDFDLMLPESSVMRG